MRERHPDSGNHLSLSHDQAHKHIHNIQQQNSNYNPHTLRIVSPNNSQTLSKHATHKTNRHINRATHNIQGYNITLTTSQVQEAIKQSKNNNSQGPDKLNIRHLKHIGLLRLAFLTSMFFFERKIY